MDGGWTRAGVKPYPQPLDYKLLDSGFRPKKPRVQPAELGRLRQSYPSQRWQLAVGEPKGPEGRQLP